MSSFIRLIPKKLQQKAIDATVDFIASLGKGYIKDEILKKIKSLRSDGSFKEAFEKGIQGATERFLEEYAYEDEDLVQIIASDDEFFRNEEIQKALIKILKNPGGYLSNEQETIIKSFDTILPHRQNRERVNKAINYFLKCLVQEVWNLPALRPIYELQFQKMTAEALREQVNLQKIQLQENISINSDIRNALLQLTESMIEKKHLMYKDNIKTLPPTIIHNLPQADYEHFIGRTDEIQKIIELLSPKTRHFVIIIDGIGGIGKSVLALEIADKYCKQYHELPQEERFDAIIWATAKQTILTGEGIITRSRSIQTLNDIYTTIAITLQREDIIRSTVDERANLIFNALKQQRTLLIIDNLETIDDEQVLSFIREVPEPTKVIVTTRYRIDVAYPIRLLAMPKEDALQLIRNTYKQKGLNLKQNESDKLYQRSGGVPLAIVWSISQMGFGHSIDVVLDRLGQSKGDIAKYCFESIMSDIEETPSIKILLAQALFASSADRNAVGYIANLSDLDRDDGLVALEKLSMINKYNDRFSLLPLTKKFIIEYLKDLGLEKKIRLRFIEYFVFYCQKFGGEKWQSYPKIDVELGNIQLSIEWAYQYKLWNEVINLVDGISMFLDRQGLWSELVEYSEMAIESGNEIQNKHAIAKCTIYGLGWGKGFRLRNINDGMVSIKKGKNIAKEIEDEKEYANALYIEGYLYRLKSEYDKSETLFKRSLTIFKKLNEFERAIKSIGALGGNERERGNLDKSFSYYNEAHKHAVKIGYTEHIAINLIRLSEILWRQSKFEDARINAKEALIINEKFNSVYRIGRSCLGLAKAYYALSNIEEAKYYAQKAYDIYSKLKGKHRIKETEELLKALNESPFNPSLYLKQKQYGIGE